MPMIHLRTLKLFADKYGWESIETDWRKVVIRDDIDLISIATPNFLHKEIRTCGGIKRKTYSVRKAIGK